MCGESQDQSREGMTSCPLRSSGSETYTSQRLSDASVTPRTGAFARLGPSGRCGPGDAVGSHGRGAQLLEVALHSRLQLQVQVVTCAAGRLAVNRRAPRPPAGRARGAQKTCPLSVTGLSQRTQKETSQPPDEEMQRVRSHRRSSRPAELGAGMAAPGGIAGPRPGRPPHSRPRF